MIEERKFPAGQIYHICNKSIANYGIFSNKKDAARFIETLDYYNKQKRLESYASMVRRKEKSYKYENLLSPKEDTFLKFISYCIMPDHYHITVKALVAHCVSKYINDIENSYTRYFNIKYKRKGPLWQSQFRVVRVKTSEQLLHLTRYQHINPTTAELVQKPEDWEFSSYRDYISNEFLPKALHEITIRSGEKYRQFCENRIDYQKKLKRIKKLLLE